MRIALMFRVLKEFLVCTPHPEMLLCITEIPPWATRHCNSRVRFDRIGEVRDGTRQFPARIA